VEAGVMTEGTLIRPLNRAGRICGGPMDPNAVWSCVQKYAHYVQVPNLVPHDLRRTFPKRPHTGKAPVEQIQISLGHSSITTGKNTRGAKSFPLFSGFGRDLLM